MKKSQAKTPPNKTDIAETALSYLLTAIISAIVGIIVFYRNKVAPFGDESVLCMDLWGQYMPMYVNNKEAEGISGLLYSWNGAFGFNNWAQSAYYCNSIFIFMLKFIPYHYLVTAIDIFCLVKIVLSSISCLALLHYKFKKKSPILIAGAVSYSLCAYMLAFIAQFMWTDLLFYTPLVLIGIERLVKEKKPLMYTLVLGISIISSFYIGFAMCIFSVLYFACISVLQLKISIVDKRLKLTGAREFGLSAVRFGVFSLLAGAISAMVIIPIGLAISQTIAAEQDAPEKLEWYGNFTSVLQNFLSGQKLFEVYDGANVAIGMMVFIAIPVYFFNKKIRPLERVMSAFMLTFLTLSLNCNVLNYFWHGLHFPNQLPARWSFMFSLFVIIISCEGLLKAESLSPKRAFAGCLSGMALIYLVSRGVGSAEEFELPKGTWIYVLIISVAIISMSIVTRFVKTRSAVENVEDEDEKGSEEDKAVEKKPDSKFVVFMRERVLKKSVLLSLCDMVLAITIVLECSGNFLRVSEYEDSTGFQTSNEVSYTEKIEKFSRIAPEWTDRDGDFYRVEANNGFTFNCSMLGSYRGMRYYSSTMNGEVFRLLKYLGNRVYADKVSTVYSLSSPVQNSLFGIRYIMDVDRYLDSILPGTVVVEENEDGVFRQNTTALPVAYAVSEDLRDYEIDDQLKAIQNQNDMLNKMCGEEMNVFVPMECTSLETENVELDPNDDWNINYFYSNSGEPQAVFHYTFDVKQGGCIFMEHNFRAGSMHVTAPNVDKTFSHGDSAFMYIGRLSEGDTVKIDVTVDNVSVGCYGINLYRMDEEVWDRAYKSLASQGLEVTEFDNTEIKGNINLSQDSLVFASLTNDGGWSVYCDGEKVETETLCGALLGAEIPQGQHEIVYKYRVPGLALGMTISITGLLLGLLLAYRERIFGRVKSENKTKKKSVAGGKTAPEPAK